CTSWSGLRSSVGLLTVGVRVTAGRDHRQVADRAVVAGDGPGVAGRVGPPGGHDCPGSLAMAAAYSSPQSWRSGSYRGVATVALLRSCSSVATLATLATGVERPRPAG